MVTTKLHANAQTNDGASFEQPQPLQEYTRVVHMLTVVPTHVAAYMRFFILLTKHIGIYDIQMFE